MPPETSDAPACCPEGGAEADDRHFHGWWFGNPLRRALFPPARYVKGRVRPGMVVADLGCGPGYLSIPLAEAVGPGGRVVAVDSDGKALDAMLARARGRSLSNVEGHVSSAAHVGFVADSSVDVLYGKGLLCCMADHGGAVGEIRRVLKPGGTAFLSVRRGGASDDPKRVRKDEWERIISEFVV